MKSPEDNAGPIEMRSDDRDELTSLPGLHTWPRVYLFVFGCFILWVLLLLALTVHYS